MENKNQEINLKITPTVIGVGLVIMMILFFGAGILFESVRKTDNKVLSEEVVTDQPETAPTQDLSLIPEVNAKEYVRGSKNAEITVIEYSDYECPFCKSFHPTMEQVLEEYGDKVAWVYRHYPLPFHPKAQKTAEAAECVGELGGGEAFWEMSDLMFEKMPDLELSELGDLAASVGVDKNKFETCLNSDKYADKVSADMNSGAAAGIQGTPGGVIIGKNGQREFIPGALPFEQVKQLIDKVM
jgi:protein-disulfide isomerase